MTEEKICEFCSKPVEKEVELVDVKAICGQGDWQVYFHFQCFLYFLKGLYKTKKKALKALEK